MNLVNFPEGRLTKLRSGFSKSTGVNFFALCFGRDNGVELLCRIGRLVNFVVFKKVKSWRSCDKYESNLNNPYSDNEMQSS